MVKLLKRSKVLCQFNHLIQSFPINLSAFNSPLIQYKAHKSAVLLNYHVSFFTFVNLIHKTKK